MAEARQSQPDREPPRGSSRDWGSDDWSRIERDDDFRALVHAKRRFIFPATVLFIVYYFALPVLVGYWPELMARDVIGEINVAYLFALSQFFLAWLIMAAYVRRAQRFDTMVARLIGRLRGGVR